MGKYMKKSKIRGDVAVVMEVTKPPTVGVCTRAKTLALDSSSFSFLQLRNRRLLKPPPSPPLVEPKKSQTSVEPKKSQHSKQAKAESVVKSESSRVDKLERSSRKSTPCRLTGESNTNRSCGSSSRRSSATETDRRGRSDAARSIPTPNEMEAFFLCAEQQLQRSFMEKYNYDIVHDLPLQGRYEWFEV